MPYERSTEMRNKRLLICGGEILCERVPLQKGQLIFAKPSTGDVLRDFTYLINELIK